MSFQIGARAYKMDINRRASEEQDVIKTLDEIRENIAAVYDRLNYSVDELITDSLNYELLALKSRHKFYTEKAKELKLRGFIRKGPKK